MILLPSTSVVRLAIRDSGVVVASGYKAHLQWVNAIASSVKKWIESVDACSAQEIIYFNS